MTRLARALCAYLVALPLATALAAPAVSYTACSNMSGWSAKKPLHCESATGCERTSSMA